MRKKIICLAGPTGSGKSAIAARLGNMLGGEVLNADSRQVYAAFPVITAQPGKEELLLCPHRLYGFLDLRDRISAGRYARLAADNIEDLLAGDRTPVLTGGTGLYFRALLEGLADIPPVGEEIRLKWQERCAALGSAELYLELSACDPVYAKKIHPHDRQRITRALEVYEGTGRNFTWWHERGRGQNNFEHVYLGVEMDLEELTPRLNRRIDLMLEQGALEEARRAMEHCAEQTAPGWSGIGCAELYRAAAGSISLEEARSLWQKRTRAYAKRQITWFRAERGLRRLRPEQFADLSSLLEQIKAF
ncbi:MAG: tRNA (adenosine(37)-N6)-dimethylallyltransferase MiaA [Deltaproteobacteria bacterium]|nr:tRNA (adenosine(37)-N6)-dimethylallyltransferase MiaA [Deltaproteobacteria bacterium]